MKQFVGLLVASAVVLIGAANLEALPDTAENWPEPFQHSFLNIRLWQWCLLGGLIVVSMLAGLLGDLIVRRIIAIRDRVAAHPLSADARMGICRASGLVVGVSLANVLLPSLRLDERFLSNSLTEESLLRAVKYPSGFGSHLQVALNTLLVVAIAMLLYSLWDATCDALAAQAVGHQKAEHLLIPMMRKFMRAIIVTCGLVFCLGTIFGTKTLTGLVAGLGVTGLVVALAGKDSVENVFGSLTILFDMPFAIGDYVRIDKVEGNVEEINLRSTRIRTTEDTLITLPNANLIRASVENFGARRTRRQKLSVRLSYTSDSAGVEKFCEKLRSFIEENENVEKGRTVVQLDDPTETSIGVTIIWYLYAQNILEEAKSRSRVLEEVLNQKRGQGLLLASLPLESPQKP